jgi:hypothetical protein
MTEELARDRPGLMARMVFHTGVPTSSVPEAR